MLPAVTIRIIAMFAGAKKIGVERFCPVGLLIALPVELAIAIRGLVLALAEAAAPRIAACRGLIGPPAAVLFHSGRWRGRAIISSVGGRIPGCAAWGLAVACLARRWRRLGTTGGACLAGLAPHIA